MNIISKEKKEIRWLGLPTNSVQECNSLEKEKQTKLDQIQKKTQQLQELILQVNSWIIVLKPDLAIIFQLLQTNLSHEYYARCLEYNNKISHCI